MSDQSDSQNKSEEQVNMSEGTSPSSSYDDGNRSTPSNLPKAATRSRKKITSDSEDEDYVATEEEVSSNKAWFAQEGSCQKSANIQAKESSNRRNHVVHYRTVR